ncbi:MAG TPA: DUF222 domain-containing protein, partial [Nocardioidaceae bacterium]
AYHTRMGQALCELIEHLSADAMPQHGVGNAQIVIILDEQAMRHGTGPVVLDTGDQVSVAEARRLACNACIMPMVLNGRSRILDLGMGQRLFDRNQRLALAHRDGGCVFPGCERPPAWCDGRSRATESPGPAQQATCLVLRRGSSNGCLVCGFHHRLIHKGDWSIQTATDGVVEVIPPDWVDLKRQPLRHQRFKPRPG